jgi:zinc protease
MRVALLTIATALVATAVAAGGVFPYRYEVHTLDNGLKVILIPTPSQGLVAYYSVVRTGSRDEVEPGHSGFAHFFEHMMFRGTKKVPGDVYDKLMTGMGANANAYTTDDYTCFHLNVASSDLPRVIELEADRFQNLSYAEADFQTEAGAVYGEYRKGRTSPFEVLDEALRDRAFDVHTYKHTVIGFEKDVAAMPTMYEYSKSFFARFYRPENVVIVVAGDFDPARTLAEITKQYGAWKPGYVAPAVHPEPAHKGERRVNATYQGRTLPIVTVAWEGVAFDAHSKDVAAGMLLADLAFGETSAAYRELVLDKHVAQRVIAEFGFNRDPGLWLVLAMVANEKDVPAVEATLELAAARLREAPPDAKQLDALKRRVRYQFLMDLDTPDHVAGSLARYVAESGGIEAVDQLFATIDSLRPADVQSAARRLLVPRRRTVAILKGVDQ